MLMGRQSAGGRRHPPGGRREDGSTKPGVRVGAGRQPGGKQDFGLNLHVLHLRLPPSVAAASAAAAAAADYPAANYGRIFTSDHGYHLGQFRIPDEKMMPYETDIRVPFYARGPGIKPGTAISEMISNIDVRTAPFVLSHAAQLGHRTTGPFELYCQLAVVCGSTHTAMTLLQIGPTLCELAGLTPPPLMDGRSLVPLLTDTREKLSRPWRTHFMTEFAEGGTQEWGTNRMWNTTDGFDDLTIHPPWG
eukprot:COSAG05_NODE_1633_length_4368_cov_1.606934_2_plen_248_part_00